MDSTKELFNLLIVYSEMGDIDSIKSLFNDKQDTFIELLYMENETGSCALGLAVKNDHMDVVEFYL